MPDWSKIKYFDANENWGDASKIDQSLLVGLDELRFKLGSPIIISSGTDGRHQVGSFHYDGKAVDVVAPNSHIFNFFVTATRVKAFDGIGVYPEWSYRGIRCGGLHLDVGGSFGRRWLYHDAYYRELNFFFAKESGMI